MKKHSAPKEFFAFAWVVLVCLLVCEVVFMGIVFVLGGDSGRAQPHFPLLNIPRLFAENTLRDQNFEVEAGYFIFDPSLGARFRPNSKLVSLESAPDGTPRIATQKELWTDSYGYVANGSTKGGARDYGAISGNNSVFRIITTGGSTVTGWGASNNAATWPAVLEGILNAQLSELGLPWDEVAVINAGVFGYNISQEIKFYADELCYLNPHLVVSFGGINENWGYKGDPVRYTYKSPHHRLIKLYTVGADYDPWYVLPNFGALVHRLSSGARTPHAYGYENPQMPAFDDITLYNSKITQYKALCESTGADFVFLLQPTMGTGSKTLADSEEILKNFFGTSVYRLTWEDYQAQANAFFDRVETSMAETWRHNLRGIFDEVREPVYADPRHYNDLGQRILAERIAKEIVASGILSPKTTPPTDNQQ